MPEKPPTQKFEHPDGRSTSVDVEEGKKIGHGHFADIHEAVVTVGSRKALFVTKKFKEELSAKEAFKIYKVAKKAGLKVFPTYRLGEDRSTILMTPGNTEKWICLGSNPGSSKMEDFGEEKMGSIENADEVIDSMFGQAHQATRSHIRLHADAFFFMIDRETKKKIDFVLGDLDNVNPNTSIYNENVLLISNLKRVAAALSNFFSSNVKDPEPYLEQVDETYNRTMAENGLWNV